MILKGMKITNQLLYQLSYKGNAACIINNDFISTKIKLYCSQLLLQLLALYPDCSQIVTNKSYSNRTQNPAGYGISKIIPFMTNKGRNENETKKQKK
tara:strand:- start:1642 stop:1932 length:291 start_codon:yes stop_codon:yes gene_type:complete